MLLAALLLWLQQPATTPPAPPGLTYGFTTESVEIEFDTPSSRLLWTGDQHDEDPTRPASSLELACSASAPAECVLRPTHVEGKLELFLGACARIPAGCELSVDARTTQAYRGDTGAAWVRALDLGEAALAPAAESHSVPVTLARSGGHLRMLAPEPYLQLRLLARTTRAAPQRISIRRICWAGFDRSCGSSREWGPMPGGCGLSVQDWYEREREYRSRSRTPHELCFVAALPPARQRDAAAAALAMLLPEPSERLASELRAQLIDLNGACEPGGWLPAVEAHAARGTLRCFSIWPEVEMALGGGGPFAIRVQDSAGSLRWIVLSSFDAKQNALVYDPSSKEPQPARWTRDELEQRWFGAGGLAFACRR